MRIKHENIAKATEVIEKLNFEMLNGYVFFPLDLEVKRIDEYGIESKAYKAETYFGNTLIPGLLLRGTECVLAYVQTTSLFSFNLVEYLSIIPQPKLSSDDINFISEFESCLVKSDDVCFSSMIMLNGEFSTMSSFHPQILNEEGGCTCCQK